MKFINHKDKSEAGRIALATAGALFLGLLSFTAMGTVSFADDDSGSGGQDGDQQDDDGGPGGGFAHDEEAVGTLPTRGKEEPAFEPPTAPGFYIQGPRNEVYGALIGAYGDGIAIFELIENPEAGPGAEPDLKITFEGMVTAQLDAAFLSNSQIEAGVATINPVGSTTAAAMTEDSLLMTAVLNSQGNAAMPLGAFAEAGYLGEGVHILTSNRILGRDQIDINSLGGIIEIRQGNPLGL